MQIDTHMQVGGCSIKAVSGCLRWICRTTWQYIEG